MHFSSFFNFFLFGEGGGVELCTVYVPIVLNLYDASDTLQRRKLGFFKNYFNFILRGYSAIEELVSYLVSYSVSLSVGRSVGRSVSLSVSHLVS